MTVREVVENYDIEIDSDFVIGFYNDDTGEDGIIYKSWEDSVIPHEFLDYDIHYIIIKHIDGIFCIYFEITIHE